MTIANYGQLKTAVVEWANRGDAGFAVRVPDFITLGEARVYRRLRLSRMVKSVNLPTAANNSRVPLPADWLEFRLLALDLQKLEYRPMQRLTGTEGTRKYYSVEGDSIQLDFTPSGAEQITVNYYARPAAMAVDSDTNWVLANCPDVYLYAALIDASIWVKDQAAAGQWGSLLDKAIGEATSADRAATISGSPLRIAR